MNKMIAVLGVLILVGIGGVLLLGNNQSNNQPASREPIEGSETSTENVNGNVESEDQSGVKEFTVESRGMVFTPNEIRVNAGDTVRITYKNTLGSHDFTLDEFNVKTPLINAGDDATVEFVADKPGTYEFYCSVPGHREAGMIGSLVVE